MMPTYVTLFKWTEQGTKDMKNAPARFAASKNLIESVGGKVLGIYVTMGKYDVVAVTEGPSDEAAAAAVLSIASKGNVTSMTMRAFTEKEFAEIVQRLP
ncbi:MAG: GYD domain-containing protein [Acidobacteriales bacterium]|nr:GYD domain-containing protein [Terriglobales bacterium]